jgi:hypothetical protein
MVRAFEIALYRRKEIPALQSVTETVTVDYKRWSVRHLPRLLVLAAALLCLLLASYA